jgi:hypothetical protein
MSEGRPDLADAALAAASAAIDLARLPLGLAARLPGVRLLAREGALVRPRVRSQVEGLLTRALDAPEAHRILQRVSAQLSADGTPPLQRASPPPAP